MCFVSLPMYWTRGLNRTMTNYTFVLKIEEQSDSNIPGHVTPHCDTRPISIWAFVAFRSHLFHDCKLAKRYFFVHRTNQQTKAARVLSLTTAKQQKQKKTKEICSFSEKPVFHLNSEATWPQQRRSSFWIAVKISQSTAGNKPKDIGTELYVVLVIMIGLEGYLNVSKSCKRPHNL